MWFCPLPPSYIHSFPTFQDNYAGFNESFMCSSHELSLELSLADLEMDESTLLADFMLSRMTSHSRRRRRATVEVNPR